MYSAGRQRPPGCRGSGLAAAGSTVAAAAVGAAGTPSAAGLGTARIIAAALLGRPLRRTVGGRTVLDLCCCTGGSPVHASLYGAQPVEAADVSAEALSMVRRNAALNGCANIITTEANVFDLVRRYSDEGRRYGTVILDPPAFAKSKRVLESAYTILF